MTTEFTESTMAEEFTKATGLSFTEAVASGFEIKRKSWRAKFKVINGKLRSVGTNNVFEPVACDILATDWEIIAPKLTFTEAAKQMERHGSNVARLAWLADPPYEIHEWSVLLVGGKDQDNLRLTVEDLNAHDWVVIDEDQVVPILRKDRNPLTAGSCQGH